MYHYSEFNNFNTVAYKFEKNKNGEQDLVISGWENGMAANPHKGLGFIKGANISTEEEEIMCSFARVAQLQSTSITGTLTPISQSTVSFTTNPNIGDWFSITTDSGTGLTGTYYYLGSGQISATFQGPAVTNIVLNTSTTIIFLTSGTSWTVPSDWNNINNSIEVIGGGGAGGGGNGSGQSGSGGGGGGYSKITNLSLTPAATIAYVVGAGGTSSGSSGTDTYFNGASFGVSSVGAKGGGGGVSSVGGAGGVGGASSSGIGTTKYSGGTGGITAVGPAPGIGGGGGGAAGLNGNGAAGGAAAGSGGSGGQGDNGFGGTGGAGGGGGTSPGNGASGTEYDASHGSGGGGGGSANRASPGQNGGNGGSYGAGGGGSSDLVAASGGTGSQGLIRIAYQPLSPITTSATYSIRSMGQPLQSATESYFDGSGNQQYRYYVLDSLGDIWVHDSAITSPVWFSPLATLPSNMTRPPSGLAVINGWVSYALAFATNQYLYFLSTSMLSVFFGSSYPLLSSTNHATLVGHQGRLYYTDGNYIGSIFPNTSLVSGAANIQSYASWTAPTIADNTIGKLSLISGAVPYINGSTRVPVVFFSRGTTPTAIIQGTVYYVSTEPGSNYLFQVFSAASGGSALDLVTGSTGIQYFNTFYPVSTGGQATITITQQALNLPSFETAQCMVELGNSVLIGCKGNVLYPWNQVDVTPGDVLPLAENNVVNMITANTLTYIFAGQKGNIYICNGSSVSPAISVGDYCAGIPGTPNTYIEPYFSWGGAMFMRGRIWFSILDQTSTKAGNCGGVWSFVPSNNLFSNQTQSLALREENKSSYGTYSGLAAIMFPNQNQLAIGPQYWTGWYSSITSPTYGIDYSDTIPQQVIIETDLIPTGTLLQKQTFQQIEYKMATPLITGETVIISYRLNGTDAYTALSNSVISETGISGYFVPNFQLSQWLQLQITLTPLANTSSSFCRLVELRLR